MCGKRFKASISILNGGGTSRDASGAEAAKTTLAAYS